jgi:raffinose/stachyose/melibiose transport system permease protein
MVSEARAEITTGGRISGRRLKTRTTLIGMVFLAPAFVLISYTNLIPTVWNFILSFQSTNIREFRWVGLENFANAFGDRVFLSSLGNSVLIAVVSTIFAVIIGVALAIMIFEMRQVEGAFYRLIIFMPTMIPLAITGVLFIFVYNPASGMLNNFLRLVGLDDLTQAWLGRAPLSLFAISVVNIWRIVGLPMMLVYAALQSIPESLLEASKLDGASYFQYLRFILLPLLKPIVRVISVFVLIINFKAFDLVLVLTNGGPGNTSRIVPIHIVETAFTYNKFGEAASQGVVMTFVILIFLLVLNRVLRSENYEY